MIISKRFILRKVSYNQRVDPTFLAEYPCPLYSLLSLHVLIIWKLGLRYNLTVNPPPKGMLAPPPSIAGVKTYCLIFIFLSLFLHQVMNTGFLKLDRKLPSCFFFCRLSLLRFCMPHKISHWKAHSFNPSRHKNLLFILPSAVNISTAAIIQTKYNIS